VVPELRREGKLESVFCLRCYARECRNRAYFAGLRPRVLARDVNTCQVCGREEEGKCLSVHHRRCGVSKVQLLITLCPACHAVIHRTQLWRAHAGPLAAVLWREQHPGAAEQLALPFDQGSSPGHSQDRVLWGLWLAELVPVRPDFNAAEERLKTLALNGIASAHTRRAYETGLELERRGSADFESAVAANFCGADS